MLCITKNFTIDISGKGKVSICKCPFGTFDLLPLFEKQLLACNWVLVRTKSLTHGGHGTLLPDFLF